MRHRLLAILRPPAELAYLAVACIALAVANRVWIRRLRAMGAYDKKDFTGKGIPGKIWTPFLDELADILREMRSTGKRES